MENDHRLLVIIPALNEEATVEQVIAGIPQTIEGITGIEILVIDDGSTDRTVQFAWEAGATVISHSRNLGVGVAIQRGLAEAIQRDFDMAVNIDADGQFNSDDIHKLVRPIIDGEVEFTTASRFKDPALIPQMPWIKLKGNLWMSRLVSFLTGETYYDVSCGFRAYSREAMLRLALTGRFTYTQETFLILSFKGMRILEVPIPVRGMREKGESRVASNLWNYTFRTLGIILSCFRDYQPASFFNAIAVFFFSIALALGSFFIGHRITAGAFSPHIWSGFTAAVFFFVAFVVFLFGQLASMINRVRFLQEEQLYLSRLKLGGPKSGNASKKPVD